MNNFWTVAKGVAIHYMGTSAHKYWVAVYLLKMAARLVKRAITHDNSKYSWIEAEGFAKVIDRLKGSTYGSPEYKETLRRIRPSIEHHKANNPHHPEFHKEGINGMDLVDLAELAADWRAAVKRHADGNPVKSMEINKGRFTLEDQLFDVLANTVFGEKPDVPLSKQGAEVRE